MRVRIASFGVGLLAGLGTAIGYSQVRHLRLKETDVLPVLSGDDSQEKELFKWDSCMNSESLVLWVWTWLLNRYGRPESPQSLHTYTSHSVLYDHCRKVPLWSAELITKEHISGSANRRKSRFQVYVTVILCKCIYSVAYRKTGRSVHERCVSFFIQKCLFSYACIT